MHAFRYQRPDTVQRALAAFEQAEDARFLAGGQTLLPVMKHRLASPTDLIDLAGVDTLAGITATGDTVTIGAMATHARVAAHAQVRQRIPALAALAGGIGDPHVRNRGTLGGSIANNDPAADYPAAVVGLEATVRTDRREIASDDVFTGFFETALADGELITEVVFPVPEAAAYCKFENAASRYAVVGVLVARFQHGVRVAVTGAAPCVFRLRELEAALADDFAPERVRDFPVDAADCNDDLHASAAYRAHLVGVIAERAVTGLREGA